MLASPTSTSAHIPIYKNKLEKAQNMSKFAKHRAQLQIIAKGASHRYPQIQQSYKDMLYDNNKAVYYRQQRNKQISIENSVLLTKIQKIKAEHKKPSFWLKDRSHSLNQFMRSTTMKSIDAENKKLLKGIITQKPHISMEELNKSSIEQERLSSSISKMEKYRLPQIDSVEKRSSLPIQTQRSFQSKSQSQSQSNGNANANVNTNSNTKPQAQSQSQSHHKTTNSRRLQQIRMDLDYKGKQSSEREEESKKHQ